MAEKKLDIPQIFVTFLKTGRYDLAQHYFEGAVGSGNADPSLISEMRMRLSAAKNNGVPPQGGSMSTREFKETFGE